MVASRLQYVVALVAMLLLPSSVSAQGDQRARSAINNVHQEMMARAAYFNIYAACLAHSNYDGKTVDGLRRIATEFIDRGDSLAKEIGLTPDAMASRFKLANEDQLNLIKKDCVNISSLISRYHERCFLILVTVPVERSHELVAMPLRSLRELLGTGEIEPDALERMRKSSHGLVSLLMGMLTHRAAVGQGRC